MAVGGGFVWDETFIASEDMASYQYHLVKTGSVVGECTLSASSRGPVPLGVLQNNPKQGETATVRMIGRSKAWASGSTAIAVADFLACGSQGHYEIAVATGSMASAIALEAMTAGACVVISVLQMGNYQAIAIDNTP